MGDTPERVLLELAIDAATRVLATPGNFSDAAKWLIQLDPEQVLPDPLDTPEAHENAMRHRRRTQAPHVRKLLAAWDTVTHKARYCHVAHGSDAWQVTRDDACKIVLLAAFLREDFDGDSLGFNYPRDEPDKSDFSFERRCWIHTLLTSGAVPDLTEGLVIEFVQMAIRILPTESDSHKSGVTMAIEPEFRCGSWFTLNTNIPTARLRQAARPDRKTKRVRKRIIGSVVCYSVVDARRLWDSDMHKA